MIHRASCTEFTVTPASLTLCAPLHPPSLPLQRGGDDVYPAQNEFYAQVHAEVDAGLWDTTALGDRLLAMRRARRGGR